MSKIFEKASVQLCRKDTDTNKEIRIKSLPHVKEAATEEGLNTVATVFNQLSTEQSEYMKMQTTHRIQA